MKSDAEFIKVLKDSKHSEFAVARHIVEHEKMNFSVLIKPLKIRPDQSQRFEYSDKGDLELCNAEGTAKVGKVECKHIQRHFLSLRSFDFKSIIVDEVHSYDKKKPSPMAYYICNKNLTGAIVVSVKHTRNKWFVKKLYDKKSKQHSEYYMVDIGLCEYVELPAAFEVLEMDN